MHHSLCNKYCKAPLAVAITLATLSATSIAQESSSKTQLDIEEIIVTGTKRAENIQDAVQSITLFKESDVVGLQSGFDIFDRIPNVVVQSGSFMPTVRGLDGNGIATGGGGAVSGASPRMSSYVDGVARTYGASPDGQGSFWDMQQVEVYKGSQSSQLGQNSIAGAIIQTTKDPVFQDEFSAQLGAHDEKTTLNGAFMANTAFGDNFAIRLTGEVVDGKNAIDYSKLPDPGLNSDDKDELDNIEFSRYRLKAKYLASDDLILKAAVEQEHSENPYGSDSVTLGSRREVSHFNYGHYESTNTIKSLSAIYTLSNEWSADVVVSNQRAKSQFSGPQHGNPAPENYLNFSFDSDETALEPKLSFKSADSRTGSVIGAFYKTRDRQDFGKPGSAFALTADDQSKTASVYADMTLELSEQWDLLVAGRYEDAQQKRNFSAFGGLLKLDFDERNKVFLPKVGTTYHFSDDASVSLLNYKGYNTSGGGLSFVSFTPYLYKKETAQTTELVTRSQWLDRRLTVNANIFHTQLSNMQISAIGPLGPNDSIYINLDKATSSGAETELDFRLNDTWSTYLSVGLLDTEINNFGSAANNIHNGNELGLSPHLTARMGINYSQSNLQVGGGISHIGERYTDYKNLDVDKLDAYSVADIHASYTLNNITFTGYVNNLFDKYVTYASFTSSNSMNVNEPRTLGVNVKVDF